MGDSKSSLSRSLKMIQYWKWQLTDQAGMLPRRDVDRLQKWANTNLCSSTKEMQSPAAQEHRLGANKQKGSRERPDIPSGHQVDHEPPNHLWSKQGQQHVGCIRRNNFQQVKGGDLSPLLRAGEINLECWDTCFHPQYNRDMDILLRV